MHARGTIENDVLFGDDGELYLAQGGHHVLDIVTGQRAVAPAMFSIFQRNILQRARRSHALGAQYLHVVFPDKQSVLRERYPYPDPICLGLLYRQRCQRALPHMLDLTDDLRPHAAVAFQRTDTHLADHGLALAAARMAQALLGTDQSASLQSLLGKLTKTRLSAGDLGRRFDPPIESLERVMQVDWPVAYTHNGMASGNDGLIDIHRSPGAQHRARVLLFGDSFGRGVARVLSFFFAEIIVLRTRFFHEEMVRLVRPDIVLTQNAERYLNAVAPDSEAPPFLDYPRLRQVVCTPDAAFLAAFSAVTSKPGSDP